MDVRSWLLNFKSLARMPWHTPFSDLYGKDGLEPIMKDRTASSLTE